VPVWTDACQGWQDPSTSTENETVAQPGYRQTGRASPMMNCIICDELIWISGDYFYGAHIACAKQAVDYEAQAMAERRDEIRSSDD